MDSTLRKRSRSVQFLAILNRSARQIFDDVNDMTFIEQDVPMLNDIRVIQTLQNRQLLPKPALLKTIRGLPLDDLHGIELVIHRREGQRNFSERAFPQDAQEDVLVHNSSRVDGASSEAVLERVVIRPLHWGCLQRLAHLGFDRNQPRQAREPNACVQMRLELDSNVSASMRATQQDKPPRFMRRGVQSEAANVREVGRLGAIPSVHGIPMLQRDQIRLEPDSRRAALPLGLRPKLEMPAGFYQVDHLDSQQHFLDAVQNRRVMRPCRCVGLLEERVDRRRLWPVIRDFL
mmetsp:Transcript_5416/g.13029  ORF Transcript_5416/g.13029 Transcript_5416/m.13029 type:complete len:290 (+) Transcript_5416:770-1639(+)